MIWLCCFVNIVKGVSILVDLLYLAGNYECIVTIKSILGEGVENHEKFQKRI